MSLKQKIKKEEEMVSRKEGPPREGSEGKYQEVSAATGLEDKQCRLEQKEQKTLERRSPEKTKEELIDYCICLSI